MNSRQEKKLTLLFYAQTLTWGFKPADVISNSAQTITKDKPRVCIICWRFGFLYQITTDADSVEFSPFYLKVRSFLVFFSESNSSSRYSKHFASKIAIIALPPVSFKSFTSEHECQLDKLHGWCKCQNWPWFMHF